MFPCSEPYGEVTLAQQPLCTGVKSRWAPRLDESLVQRAQYVMDHCLVVIKTRSPAVANRTAPVVQESLANAKVNARQHCVVRSH